MEECIEHFSHEHPLNFFQLHDLDDPKAHTCAICELPILSSPSYTCSIDANCNFFLHKPCTQLPQELYHDAHSDTLHLVNERQDDSSRHNFSYTCQNYSRCKFQLHPLSVKATKITSKHVSHKLHPLVACCRKIVSQCDACGEEHKGFFFHCQECDFWIHQDFTILPPIVKLLNQPHPFMLSYSLPFLNIVNKDPCFICGEQWRLRSSGVYFDQRYNFAHITCAKSRMMNLHTESVPEITQLPEEGDGTFPSMVIRRSIQTNPSSQRYHHNYPLILEEGSNISSFSTSKEAAYGDDSELEICDVCIQPLDISSPFYRCQSDGCHFFAHPICADNLPTNLQICIPPTYQDAKLCDSDSNKAFFNSVFPCLLCFYPCNGFGYRLYHQGVAGGFCDLECAFAPKTIKRASHRQHILFQIFDIRGTFQLKCCSGEHYYFDIYGCIECDFKIHTRCALLPKKTRHKFDEHNLDLIMSHDHNEEDNKQQEVFCEVCEQEIELKLWHYGCYKCEQFFHINCIPSVGYLSKVKFGKTLANDDIHPDHPLALTRMLTHGRNERCGVCNQIIKGFVDDEMAFSCSACDFWIHFSCASATTQFTDYAKFLQRHKRTS